MKLYIQFTIIILLIAFKPNIDPTKIKPPTWGRSFLIEKDRGNTPPQH